MTLPSVEAFSQLDRSIVRALGVRLHELDLGAGFAELLSLTGVMPDAFTRGVRLHHLRRRADPRSLALRLLLLEDVASIDEARTMLGGVPLEPFLEGGLFTRGADGILCPFPLRFCDDTLFFADDLRHGGDAVMGVGRMTISVTRAAIPSEPVARALDLGCGAGVTALLLAPHAVEVVATDINPRAAVFTRFNAALNGVENIVAYTGDLFAPIPDPTFDLIVSQPPFVPAPASGPSSVYMHGGRRGDELPLRFIHEMVPTLRPSGRAVLYIQWPEVEGEELAPRIRAAMGRDDLDLLVLDGGHVGLAPYCIGELLTEGMQASGEFDRAVVTAYTNLEDLGLHGVRETFTLLQRPPVPRAGFTGRSALDLGELRGSLVDLLLEAHALAADQERLLSARLRFPKGTLVAADQTRAELLFPEGWMVSRHTAAPSELAALRLLTELPTVAEAARKWAKQQRCPPLVATSQVLAIAREALGRGLVIGGTLGAR
ncbi:MAG: methyltransferase [Myxococcales bacterium]|nr:methyltransferase [Myxococcales bacterium]